MRKWREIKAEIDCDAWEKEKTTQIQNSNLQSSKKIQSKAFYLLHNLKNHFLTTESAELLKNQRKPMRKWSARVP